MYMQYKQLPENVEIMFYLYKSFDKLNYHSINFSNIFQTKFYKINWVHFFSVSINIQEILNHFSYAQKYQQYQDHK